MSTPEPEALESVDQHRAQMERFHVDQAPPVAAFRDYWKSEYQNIGMYVKLINDVRTGATPVSQEALEQCRHAHSRLRQIQTVLGDLSQYVGGHSTHAVMHIFMDVQSSADRAAAQLKTIERWLAGPDDMISAT